MSYRFNKKALKELIKIGLPFSFWETSIHPSGLQPKRLGIFLDGVAALGLFSVAYFMRSAMNALPMSIWQVLTPRVVTALAEMGACATPTLG